MFLNMPSLYELLPYQDLVANGGEYLNTGGDDLLSADKAVLMRRGAGIRFIYYNIVFLLLVNDRTYASIGVLKHPVQIFILLFRNVDGLRIQFFQHGIHSGAHDPVDRQGIDIRTVEFHNYGIIYFRPLAEFEILGLSISVK